MSSIPIDSSKPFLSTIFLLQVVKHPSKVIEIQMKKSGFRMEAGQVRNACQFPMHYCVMYDIPSDMRPELHHKERNNVLTL